MKGEFWKWVLVYGVGIAVPSVFMWIGEMVNDSISTFILFALFGLFAGLLAVFKLVGSFDFDKASVQ